MADLKKYRSFLERLVRITHEEPYDREKYVELIHDMSEHYRLTKGITYFYKTPLMEKIQLPRIKKDAITVNSIKRQKRL